MKQVGIIGCGWLGLRMAYHLQHRYQINVTVTSEEKSNTLLAEGIPAGVARFADDGVYTHTAAWAAATQQDVIIITVPFSKSTPTEQLNNRFHNLHHFLGAYNKQLFLMSSIGVYPQVPQLITENNLPEEMLTANILTVEKLVRSFYPQVNILRLGGLMGDNRVFSKYKVTGLDQPVNHVHYQDICLAVEKMIQQQTTAQTYNIVAPMHPSKDEVMHCQQQLTSTPALPVAGRIISADAFVKDLDFQYTYPDPRLFPIQ